MSAAAFATMLVPVWIGVAVTLFLCLMAASPEAERTRRRARARDLARYRHHPDANLLNLTD